MKHPISKNYDLSHVKILAGGGAPISADLEKSITQTYRIPPKKLPSTFLHQFLVCRPYNALHKATVSPKQFLVCSILLGKTTSWVPAGNHYLESKSKFVPSHTTCFPSTNHPLPLLLQVVNENGEPLGPNQQGEICFASPTIMMGYIGNPQATKEVIDSDGFFHTGDIGYYDEEGFFFIVDRKKELIKYKGYQVRC